MRTRVPEYDEVPPNAPSLVNSMCASGYDLESTVADIIDNSISAKSSSVRIIVNEDGASSWIAIVDDGRGMEDATLRKAMTFGCIDPAAPRDPDDLGRFGLGLKTASLSQCRRLTVFTRRHQRKGLGPLLGQGFYQEGGEMGPVAQRAHCHTLRTGSGSSSRRRKAGLSCCGRSSTG